MAAASAANSRPLSIVTGANSGIGKQVSEGLMQAGHHVILACRSNERCVAAKADLDARQTPGSCECASLDLCSLQSIRNFAAAAFPAAPSQSAEKDSTSGVEVDGSSSIRSTKGRGETAGTADRTTNGTGGGSSGGGCGTRDAALPSMQSSARHSGSKDITSSSENSSRQCREIAVLVNNAAVMGVPGSMLPNHFGPYLLTRLLLPHMAARGRVVTVASEAHYRGSLSVTPDSSSGGQLQLDPEPSNWYRQYARTKLANVLMTAQLSRRLQGRGSSVTAYSVSPGRVATGIYNQVPGLLRAPLQWLAQACFKTPAQGAQAVLHAALAPELEGQHVLYMHNLLPKAASAAAQDPLLAQRLWQLSNREVGLTPEDDVRLWPRN